MSSRAPTRKQLRKEKRKQKKARKNEYFSRGKHPKESLPDKPIQNGKIQNKTENKPELKAKKPKNKDPLSIINQERKREMEQMKVLKNNMAKQRKKQLLLANEEEDRNIKRLEKQLRLNKRKSKGLPKMFVESGLDYILDMCDPEQMKEIAAAEKKMINLDDEFAEDLALITGENKGTSKSKKSKTTKRKNLEESSDDDIMSEDSSNGDEEISESEEFSDEQTDGRKRKRTEKNTTKTDKKKPKIDETSMNDEIESDDEISNFGIDGNSEVEDEEGSELEEEEGSEIEVEEDSEIEEEESGADYEEDSEVDEMEIEEMKSKRNDKKVKLQNSKNTTNKKQKGGKDTKKETIKNEGSDMDDDLESEEDPDDVDEDLEDEESEIEDSELEDDENFKRKTEDSKEQKDKNTLNKKERGGKNTKFKTIQNDESNIDDDLESGEETEDLDEELKDAESDFEQEDSEIEDEINSRKKNSKKVTKTKKIPNKKMEKETDSEDDNIENYEDFGDEMEDEESETENCETKPNVKGAAKVNADGTWEDIYGRLHAKDGSLLNNSNQKYIPPAVRAKLKQNSTDNKETQEKLNRLKKQTKGLLNRLAISNMHNIAKQIESLYMSNSRNDMNETLGNLINESIISVVLTPERLLMEHILLIAVLHANIGTEVGAHFLQVLVSKFDETFRSKPKVEEKTLDNIVIALAQMYNFKIFDSKLLHEILNELGNEFTEKNVDCILHVLRNVGFVLRKDDPLALKNFILEANKKAASASSDSVNGSRLRFLLDVLTAIKNNNMTKIPNYDDSYSEHLKKLMKNFIRKGNYVTQLNISLEDLLKADEKGKWWVVGSAWTGNSENQEKTKTKQKRQKYSEDLLEMARKLRMNTDTRRDIFCVIMSAQDYEDAFEKLMHLGLTKNQERDIIHVILHCCVKEHPFNPYYAYLAQKFCETDRKYLLTLKYSIWDKLKAIEKQSPKCLLSLASLLIHLFLNKGLPISTLKVIEFTQMDNITTRFLRQIFLGILLHDDTESCLEVFKNIAQSDKLKMFRESLRLFLQLFVRKNLSSDKINEKQREMLQTRSKMIERLLVIKDVMNLYD